MQRNKWMKHVEENASESDAECGILFSTSPEEKITQEKARREKRRRKIERELFETEKTYLGHLELIQKYFDFPLKFACIIPDDAHSRIFSNSEQIYGVNQRLFELMEQTTVGQAFHHLGPFLKLYSTYANNHEQAISTLQEWRQKKPEFADYIQRQEYRPELKGLKLNALLITPVQRIPRYKMLLEDLLQHTCEDHHDHHHLAEATRQIAEIASHINEHIRQHENFQKMLTIQNCFDSSAPKILAPGRVFIKEGTLNKVARKGGRSHERMFFLFSDILLYGKPKLLDGGSRTYNCCCVLPLKHCQIHPVFIPNAARSDGGGMFQVTCKDESLLLYSDDQHNAKAWSDALEKAVMKLCTDRQTLRKPSSHKMPLRGRSIRKQLQKEKKSDPLVKKLFIHQDSGIKKAARKFEALVEEPDCSPLREKLAPVKDRIQSWYDEDVGTCLSPWSPRKSQENLENEDIHNISDDVFSNRAYSMPCFPEDSLSNFEDPVPSVRSDSQLTDTERCRPMSDPGVTLPAAFERYATSRPTPHQSSPRRGLNSRLRSYIQKPIQRLLRVRHNLRGACSPFRTSSAPSSGCSSRLYSK
ncbi:rho guanine nucleotide exchange factor 39-like isoform X1 [Haliotis rufescens]|uniref:rho guanine nucleotide exchange factor 39-like isoform X1 n=1 Tax=Haliotis rufescens TaxID=6454 RepID=UPI001EAFD5C0|nr:rho guanine nucleotide exchange factor 39-like isoform X1 [Haliotis rufescens]